MIFYVYIFQKEPSGYEFTVYSTAFCPGNETEWNKRKAIFNCPINSIYACFPNNEITELIEFCLPWKHNNFPIGKGKCLAYVTAALNATERYH